ncbi:helix-turn-helix domain-containing protein [Novosphingopyxis sp. YJ-S2-01]|uniref:helix-turn-helix domain-containing protein n=1 Tax=Novosphingopyxis sp. YJ-S2-01 TaxID=2794021 RepID=UPI0018DD8A80|nr:helix-turn-helix transcriptional regulator [Novosphingopyxis sp. YJ-S2-01]MBH9537199.1 helix-turn-helix transcriptional regulator [Novosphingopyxis sp. YJ-S2-01]
MSNDFPHAATSAARILAEGIARAREERDLSLRQIAKLMGYKSSVVMSHMANGRIPIPIDRVPELAYHLQLDEASFLRAVVVQRHPDVSWHLLAEEGGFSVADSLAQELEAVLGDKLATLNDDQRAVMREVVSDRRPRRRWLSVHELHAVEILRQSFPRMQARGISSKALNALRTLGVEFRDLSS